MYRVSTKYLINMARGKFQKFKQGTFYPKNKEKCFNDSGDVVYRSMLELRFMMVCDVNSHIVKWASEKIVVPYFNTGKQRMARYFVDFFIELEDGKKYIVEIKPAKEVEVIRDPELLAKRMAKSKAKKSTLLTEAFMATQNREKWLAAKEWAADHNMEFIVMTEKDIETMLKK